MCTVVEYSQQAVRFHEHLSCIRLNCVDFFLLFLPSQAFQWSISILFWQKVTWNVLHFWHKLLMPGNSINALQKNLCYHFQFISKELDVLKHMLLTLDGCKFLSLANLLMLLRGSTEKKSQWNEALHMYMKLLLDCSDTLERGEQA